MRTIIIFVLVVALAVGLFMMLSVQSDGHEPPGLFPPCGQQSQGTVGLLLSLSEAVPWLTRFLIYAFVMASEHRLRPSPDDLRWNLQLPASVMDLPMSRL